jgi:hypothetical protein
MDGDAPQFLRFIFRYDLTGMMHNHSSPVHEAWLDGHRRSEQVMGPRPAIPNAQLSHIGIFDSLEDLLVGGNAAPARRMTALEFPTSP